jgi:hypothetical protein
LETALETAATLQVEASLEAALETSTTLQIEAALETPLKAPLKTSLKAALETSLEAALEVEAELELVAEHWRREKFARLFRDYRLGRKIPRRPLHVLGLDLSANQKDSEHRHQPDRF